MSRCKHNKGNIQQFTEICLDCGHNIYESEEEYQRSLISEIENLRKEEQQDHTSKLEDERDRLLQKLRKKDDGENSGGW